MHRSDRIIAFVDTIWAWYAVHKRSLPWRDLAVVDETERAYRVLVSEVMLQQTQVSRVVIIYKRFLEQFPTIEKLASASTKDVLMAWRAMGYNSRALRLRDAAKIIIEDFGGVFPKEFNQLRSIKGVGPYTAGAIRNFAFNLPTPCIDTNIRRILHRTFVGPENSDGTYKKDDRYLLGLAGEVLSVSLPPPPPLSRPAFVRLGRTTVGRGERGETSVRNSANWHAALMDFGSLVQTKTNPKWDVCPLTAKHLMIAKPQHYAKHVDRLPLIAHRSVEPGRLVGQKFIPNRIFRGRIVEELRDAEKGIVLKDIGRRICIDWNREEHEEWLKRLIKKLVQDGMLEQRGGRYVLAG